jgi:hypothetical protein
LKFQSRYYIIGGMLIVLNVPQINRTVTMELTEAEFLSENATQYYFKPAIKQLQQELIESIETIKND